MLQYELLHFIGEHELSEEVSKRALNIIEENNFEKLKDNFEAILSQGTRHERFFEQASALLSQLYKIAKRENLLAAIMEPASGEMAEIAARNMKWTCPEFIAFQFPA